MQTTNTSLHAIGTSMGISRHYLLSHPLEVMDACITRLSIFGLLIEYQHGLEHYYNTLANVYGYHYLDGEVN